MGIKEIILECFSDGGWVRYNKTIARELGIEASISLGNVIDKHDYWNGRGKDAFFHTREDIEFETGLTPHQQRKGEKSLTNLGLIKVEGKAHPTLLRRVNWYSIDYKAIANFLSINAKSLKSPKSLKISTTSGQEFQPLDADNFDGNKNKLNKNKINKNINNIPSIASSDEPSCNDKVESIDLDLFLQEFKESGNTVSALEFEEEDESYLDAKVPVEAPAKNINVYDFIKSHALIRQSKSLPEVKYDGHLYYLHSAPDYVLETYLASDCHLMKKFYEYCDDRSFNWNVRHYECNSDRSPSVMVNESVFRRFMDWIEK